MDTNRDVQRVESSNIPVPESSNFWDNYTVPSTFLTSEQKFALTLSGTVFNIIDITENPNGTFGPEWVFTLEIPDYEEPMQMSMQMLDKQTNTPNRIRLGFVNHIRAYWQYFPNKPIPSKLITVPTKQGNDAYVFVGPDHKPKGRYFGAEDMVKQEDIPF